MRKVMIFYASYGGGHLSAARSIKENIETNYKDVEVMLVDCMYDCQNRSWHRILYSCL